MKRALAKLTLVLAGTGYSLSLLLLLFAALVSSVDPISLKGVVFGGCFPAAALAILTINSARREYPRGPTGKLMYAGCPPWMKRAAYASFFVGLAIFFLPGILGLPTPKSGIGGRVDSVILGGFGLAFYAALYAQVYSALRLPEVAPLRRCPDGHPVSMTAKFCESCGRTIEN